MLHQLCASAARKQGSFLCIPGRRHFAKKRKRLDEYTAHDAPLRAAVWRKAEAETGGFYAYSFEQMSAFEITSTVDIASKMYIQSPDFWRRAALAVGDVAPALQPKQLATCIHAFGSTQWKDEALVSALAPALQKHAAEMKAGDIAVTIQALARCSTKHNLALQALCKAAQVNPRMRSKGFAMISESLASLQFHNEGFLLRFDTFCEKGGLHNCPADEMVTMLHSLSLMQLSPTGGGHAAIKHLFDLLLRVADTLEPDQVHRALLAAARLRCEDEKVLEAFERVVTKQLHTLHLKTLPGMLDAFTQLYQHVHKVDDPSSTGSASWLEGPRGAARRTLLVRLTTRIARQLRHLRPQDAARSLQALGRVGLLDPLLFREAAELVPEQLSMRPAGGVLALLEGYAASQNPDPFMLQCLRRALLPMASQVQFQSQSQFEGEEGGERHKDRAEDVVEEAGKLDDASASSSSSRAAEEAEHKESGAAGGEVEDDWEEQTSRFPSPINPMAIEQLDDLEVVALMSAWAVLERPEALLSAVLAMESRPGMHSASCRFAAAARVLKALPDLAAWENAARQLVQSEPILREASWPQEGELEERFQRWRRLSEASSVRADDELLAICAFLDHPSREAWESDLLPRIKECSTELLPGLLAKCSSPSLRAACESEFLHRILDDEEGEETLHRLPLSAAVAAARALAQAASAPLQRLAEEARTPERPARLRRAIRLLAVRVTIEAESEAEDLRQEAEEVHGVRTAGSNDGDDESGGLEELVWEHNVSAKALVRILQALRAVQLDAPPGLLKSLAIRAAVDLTPTELLVALRQLPSAKAVRQAHSSHLFAAAATRSVQQMKSARQVSELYGLCKTLNLELGEVESVVDADSDDEKEPHGRSMPS